MAISGVKEILNIDKPEQLQELYQRSGLIDIRKENNDMRQIIKDIKRTIRKQNLKALSAPAIGVKKRVFCINFNGDVKTFINPMISNVKGIQLSRETCTSIPGREFMRPRNTDIEVIYQTPTGKIENRQLIGLAAYVFQHEMDHLDGLLLCDIGAELPDDYDSYTEEQKEEFVNEYLDELDMMKKELDAEIEKDPALKELSDGIKYMAGVESGKIEVDKTPLTSEELDEDVDE